MFKIFVFFLLILFITINQVNGLGVYYGNNINYSVNSGTRYCPNGQELIGRHKDKKPLGKNGTVLCMRMDNNRPNININGGSYTNGAWTNANVNLNINVTDNWTGVKKVWYTINGEYHNASSSFTLEFTDEGTYNIVVGAEDGSTHESRSAGKVSVGNTSVSNFVVNIDKSAPSLEIIPNVNSNWSNRKPSLNFKIVDNYKGKSIIIKEFLCSGKPENSSWISPVSTDGKLLGSCDPAVSNCDLDSNFIPNPNNKNQGCKWKCNDGYTRGNDDLCHVNSIQLTCDNNMLPKNTYFYDKNDSIAQESTNTVSYWISPIGVGIDGKFTSHYEISSNSYSPTVNQCIAECKGGYHNEDGKCVNNTSIICCKKDFPLTKAKAVGAVINCEDPNNQNNVACTYNKLCDGYVKDVLKYWDNDRWKFESEGVKDIGSLSEACGMENIPNSNGITCNPRYYLVDGGKPSQRCVEVEIGERSGQENEKHNCTNKPINSHYTSNGDNNNCDWSCNDNYYKQGSVCKPYKKDTYCTEKPKNTVWNNVNKIIQEWNGNTWSPSNISTYNTEPSDKECRFKCKDGYLWDGQICYKPACDDGYSYNNNNNKCEKSDTYDCSYPPESSSGSLSCNNGGKLVGNNCEKTCEKTIESSPNCNSPKYSGGIRKCY